MDRLTTIPLRIGDWRLDPQLGQLSRGDRTERLEARTLRLLAFLANRAGETVSVEDLLDNVWSGVVVTQDSVYQAITALRRLLGDDAKKPTYIVTVPRLGYRLIAPVSAWPDEAVPEVGAVSAPGTPLARVRRAISWTVASILVLFAAGVLAWRYTAPPPKSVAVLPFLDLTTQEMKEEYFADGLTEALIDRLSRLPDYEVPSPSASYYYRNKAVPVRQLGHELGVRYLLDGNLRESGESLRISARLVRASDGIVVWTAGYDAPKADRTKVQDDIANQVARSVDALVD